MLDSFFPTQYCLKNTILHHIYNCIAIIGHLFLFNIIFPKRMIGRLLTCYPAINYVISHAILKIEKKYNPPQTWKRLP